MLQKKLLLYGGLFWFLLINKSYGQYEFEFLTFIFDESRTCLEVFCQLPNKELVVTITLSDTAGLPMASQTHHNYLQSTDIPLDEPVLVKYVFVLESGNYTAQVTIFNPESKSSSTFNRQVRLPNYSKEDLVFSDLQFASSITVSQDTLAVLVKNFRNVVPNVVRIYGWELNTVYLYFEIYNIERFPGPYNQWINVRCTILKNNVAVKSEKVQYPFVVRSLAADLGIPVHDLGTGWYKVFITAIAPDGQIAQKEAAFTIINPSKSTAITREE